MRTVLGRPPPPTVPTPFSPPREPRREGVASRSAKLLPAERIHRLVRRGRQLRRRLIDGLLKQVGSQPLDEPPRLLHAARPHPPLKLSLVAPQAPLDARGQRHVSRRRQGPFALRFVLRMVLPLAGARVGKGVPRAAAIHPTSLRAGCRPWATHADHREAACGPALQRRRVGEAGSLGTRLLRESGDARGARTE
eukprot:scaffold14015_cov112-Isochrysis_galbana.AAC.1